MNNTRNRRPLTQRDFGQRLEQLQRLLHIDRMLMLMLIPAVISLASLSFLLGFLFGRTMG